MSEQKEQQQSRLKQLSAKIKSVFSSGQKQPLIPAPELGIYAIRWNRLEGFAHESVLGQLQLLLHPMLPWREIEVPSEIPDECIGYLSLWSEGKPILRAGLKLREGGDNGIALVLTKLSQ